MGSPAARVLDFHTCPMVTAGVPHVGGPIAPPRQTTVNINGIPAARMGDPAVCPGAPDTISQGSSSVNICGQPAARVGDKTAHGGAITLGSADVNIGG